MKIHRNTASINWLGYIYMTQASMESIFFLCEVSVPKQKSF